MARNFRNIFERLAHLELDDDASESEDEDIILEDEEHEDEEMQQEPNMRNLILEKNSLLEMEESGQQKSRNSVGDAGEKTLSGKE